MSVMPITSTWKRLKEKNDEVVFAGLVNLQAGAIRGLYKYSEIQ